MINNDISAASPGVSEPGPPRRRLSAATRVTQILDAALQVFSDKGFASARLDDIAEAAGLSKGGVYTHFASKEEIFGALLKRLIQPPMPAAPEALADEEPVTVDLLVRRVVEPMYQSLGDPSVIPQCCRPCACCWLTARACRRPSTNGTRPCLSRTSPMWRACSSVVSGRARCVAVLLRMHRG